MIILNSENIENISFDAFEDREAAFNNAVGHLLPVRYRGPSYFWRDFRRTVHSDLSVHQSPPAFITSNPRDCLAFGSAQQILSAARSTAIRYSKKPGIPLEQITEQFGLERIRHQPIRTLSGGETVRLALAKALLTASYSDELVIASPFCWLSSKHLPLLNQVVERFVDIGKKVRIFGMTGETSQLPIESHWLETVDLTPLKFDMEYRGLRIVLGTPINTITADPVYANVGDAFLGCNSPCLLVGDNGQGKSLLAKALCDAVSTQGRATIKTLMADGRPRLLFQDVVTQTLKRTLPDIARSMPSGVTPAADRLYGELLDGIEGIILSQEDTRNVTRMGNASSMLAVKAMLIAVRLARRPAALILDEPDWGLTRTAAIALVLITAEKAHALGVPLVIISHKPWWRSLAASIIQVVKQPAPQGTAGFSIDLHPVRRNQ